MTRREYWKAYASRMDALEKKYSRRVNTALMRQVNSFTAMLRAGVTATGQTYDQGIAQVLRAMHVEAGTREARHQLKMLRSTGGDGQVKQLGVNEEWAALIMEILSVHNARFVVSISSTTRDMLTAFLSDGLEKGMTLQEIAEKIDREVPQIYAWRSFAIARTELNRAANIGVSLAAESYNYQTEKTWITAGDHRVRGRTGEDLFNHWQLDGKKINNFETFNNGENIAQPGDPAASAGNTINCRCTIALTGKRDANGRLIRKPSRLPLNDYLRAI